MRDKYGEWSVLGPSPDKKYYSRCKCSCGAIKDINNSTLRLGKSKSCGHDRGQNFREDNYKKSDLEIINKRFGRLVGVERMNYEGQSRYLCNCDCGNIVEVAATLLVQGITESCGCLRKEKSSKSMGKIMEQGHKKKKDNSVEGTCIYNLKQDISKNNTTGVKGVSKMKNGKYRAYINLRREQKYLGTFDTIEDAKEARLQAEEELHAPIVEKYKTIKKGEINNENDL